MDDYISPLERLFAAEPLRERHAGLDFWANQTIGDAGRMRAILGGVDERVAHAHGLRAIGRLIPETSGRVQSLELAMAIASAEGVLRLAQMHFHDDIYSLVDRQRIFAMLHYEDVFPHLDPRPAQEEIDQVNKYDGYSLLLAPADKGLASACALFVLEDPTRALPEYVQKSGGGSIKFAGRDLGLREQGFHLDRERAVVRPFALSALEKYVPAMRDYIEEKVAAVADGRLVCLNHAEEADDIAMALLGFAAGVELIAKGAPENVRGRLLGIAHEAYRTSGLLHTKYVAERLINDYADPSPLAYLKVAPEAHDAFLEFARNRPQLAVARQK